MKWICYDSECGANNILQSCKIMCFGAIPITESRIAGSVYYMRTFEIIKTKVRGKKIANKIKLNRYDKLSPRNRMPYIYTTIFSI